MIERSRALCSSAASASSRTSGRVVAGELLDAQLQPGERGPELMARVSTRSCVRRAGAPRRGRRCGRATTRSRRSRAPRCAGSRARSRRRRAGSPTGRAARADRPGAGSGSTRARARRRARPCRARPARAARAAPGRRSCRTATGPARSCPAGPGTVARDRIVDRRRSRRDGPVVRPAPGATGRPAGRTHHAVAGRHLLVEQVGARMGRAQRQCG